MKVVLFCGGLGTRLRTHSDTIPKPLATIGVRPIIWHLMRYYAHFGHKDFILALGYQGQMIREYFLQYQESLSNDFTLSEGGARIELHKSDISDWKITFVDTGLHSNIGRRLIRVRKYLGKDELFLANYSDGLADVPLDVMIADFKKRNLVASLVSVRSPQSLHIVSAETDGLVTAVGPMRRDDMLINGGFFVLRREIFDYMEDGEELVEQPFGRLIEKRLLGTYRHLGFWQAMETFKDKITFDRMEAQGECPWMVWRKDGQTRDSLDPPSIQSGGAA
jgi:glucose-1-phosphate cytidylyltransferase